MMYIEIMDFPLDYAALNAAKIQKCLSIERQEEYLNNIYSNQSKWSNAKTLEKINENLKNIFLEYNPNNSKFEECLKNKKIENHVLQDRIDAQKTKKLIIAIRDSRRRASGFDVDENLRGVARGDDARRARGRIPSHLRTDGGIVHHGETRHVFEFSVGVLVNLLDAV